MVHFLSRFIAQSNPICYNPLKEQGGCYAKTSSYTNGGCRL